MPLLILLHGTSMTGVDMEAMPQFQLTPVAESRGFLYCYPDGGLNWPTGGKAWNQFFPENDPVLDVGGLYIDDIAYLASVIEELGRRFALDGKRIYLTGASGGAFMADSVALARADLIAGIASLSGAIDFDVNRYKPSEPVNILHLHGTADSAVPYWGGTLTIPRPWPANWTWRPGLLETMAIWAGYNGTGGLVTDSAPTLDLMTDLSGLDTVVTRYTHAPPGGAVELWTVVGGGHGLGTPTAQYKVLLIDWLLAHSKP
jgi:polyhydroxybutyrate depolymerase